MSKNYFTQDTEDAIVAYNLSSDFDEKSKIYSDGRLKFHYYRLLWNGVGFMKKASVNLINLWNGGEKDPTKLTCKNLTYMYNIYSKNSLIKESLEAVKFLTGL